MNKVGVFKGMPSVAEGVLNIGPFMEGGVIEEDDSGWGPLREEDVLNPGEEDIGVDAAFK